MKITTLIASTMMLLGTLGLVQADEKKTSQMIEPVVKIDRRCSASIIKSEKNKDGEVETTLLTAKHCVSGGSKKEGVVNITVTDRGKPIIDTNVWYDRTAIDLKNDLATIKLRDTTTVYPTVTIAEEIVVDEGDGVFAVGYPLGWTRTITNGLYNGYGYYENTSYLRASPNIFGGNSGGALFQENDGNYELIGVTAMKVNGNEFMNFFVPLKEIREFLRLKGTDGTDIENKTIEIPPMLYGLN